MPIEDILKRFKKAIAVDLSPDEFESYLFTMCTLFIHIIRAIKGDEFARGFLQGAIIDIDSGKPPIIKSDFKPERTH